MAANFGDFVPSVDHPRVRDLDKTDPQRYSINALQNPVVQGIVSKWKKNLGQPYFDITSNGQRKPSLFALADEGAPTEQVVEYANRITALFIPTELEKFYHGIDSDDWRKWSNPEIIIHRNGIRLEDLAEHQAQAILALV